MKSSFLTKFLAVGVTVLMSLPAIAQEDALKDYPGYVDFGDLTAVFGDPTIQISVGESLLGLVGSLSAKEDPETAELFKRLNGVRVNVFETESMALGGVDVVKDISAQLSERGWESVVTVNSEDEQVRIFMKLDNDRVQGITVMAVEDDEAVFVNVIGSINPADLSKVMDNFDININGGDHDSAD